MEIEIKKLKELSEERIDCKEIIKICSDELSYNQFFIEYMSNNIPVIIKNVNLLRPVSQGWFENNLFNIDKFEEIIRDIDVPVYNCSKKYFNSHEKITMKFKDYVNYWKLEDKKELLYLKDFHLKQQLPEIDFYNVPQFFASDWLNEYLIDNKKDDYRFVYIGVKGTWTPLHADVLNSYSWSGNVCGKKRWLMIPPGEESKLVDKLGQLSFSVDENILKYRNVKFFDIIQESNEILFVPSRWYHQVMNLTDVFSINHNWFNSCNAHTIKESLLKNFDDVKLEIQDCKNMENFDDHCQLMLKSLFGIDFQDFIDILIHIGMKRFENNLETILFDQYSVGNNLAEHDIKIVHEILEEMYNLENISYDSKLKIQIYLNKEVT